jgi:serine/threonine-protein kinase
MGEVRRVFDQAMNRFVAMKIIHPDLAQDGELASAFIAEARATAQLEHPGIITVHEWGYLSDGRPYFTMNEVKGRTLKVLIRDIHASPDARSWEGSPGKWTFRRLIDAFHKVCEAMSYAHSTGIVHRDLKPSNIMVGDYGEVRVMDWGLVGLHARSVPTSADTEKGSPQEDKHSYSTVRRRPVAGTPAYMSPEQAKGQHHLLGPRSDVYSLGSILYEILAGRPAFEGNDAREVIAQVASGMAVPALPRRSAGPSVETITGLRTHIGVNPIATGELSPLVGPNVPDELIEICMRAMARDAHARYPDAGQLASAVAAWLDGAQRRETALSVVLEADNLYPRVQSRRSEAIRLRREAAELLGQLRGNASIQAKQPGWKLDDRADQLMREADVLEVQYLQTLRASLTHVAELPEAYARLASYYREQHAMAEANRNWHAAAQCELLLRTYDRGQHTAYLRGDGVLTLLTDPPGATVTLERYELVERRLVAGNRRSLGKTPLRQLPLAMGSYLLHLEAPGRSSVRFPVIIGRQEHWAGIPPEAEEPVLVRLPGENEIGPFDEYVPAGWFWSGGDLEASNSLPRRRLWADGFIMRRFPVTNREYLIFLNALVDEGRETEALNWAPRERVALMGAPADPIYGRDDGGHFYLRPDADGDDWLPEWPVFMIGWDGAMAYADWLAARTGLPWRLPAELEWEKAARGVDGRLFPWGDFADPTWACVADSHDSRPQPASIDSFPIDASPYGIRGLGGNVRDWCLDAYNPDGPPLDGDRVIVRRQAHRELPRVARGGYWLGALRYLRCAYRYRLLPSYRHGDMGFRLVRSYPGT